MRRRTRAIHRRRSQTSAKPLWQADRDYYVNNVASQVESPTSPDRQLDAKGQVKVKKSEASEAKEESGSGTTTGFPPAAKELGKREALATTKGISPRKTASRAGQQNVQRAKLLTLLVEFNPNANDDFSGWERPDPTGQPATASSSPRARCSTAHCTTSCPIRRRSAGAPTTTRSGCPTSRRASTRS